MSKKFISGSITICEDGSVKFRLLVNENESPVSLAFDSNTELAKGIRESVVQRALAESSYEKFIKKMESL